MNKQQALEILQKHVDWCALVNEKVPVDVSKEENPNNVWCDVSKQDSQLYEDFCKENGKIEFDFDEEGGEDQGTYAHTIHKITHPTLGEAYLMYVGNYDSWNGTDWDYQGNPKLVQPQKRMVEVTDWIDV